MKKARLDTYTTNTGPVNVIVQGLPWNEYQGEWRSSNRSNHKTLLEELFSTYGPVKCEYLLHDTPPKGEQMYSYFDSENENIAHLIFENANDATAACQAAARHEIKIQAQEFLSSTTELILTLTAVSESFAPIDQLNDYCLIKIFSRLSISERLSLELVCKRWNEVAKESWSNVKSFKLPSRGQASVVYLKRCSKYLQKVNCRLTYSDPINLILKYCQHIEALVLPEINYRHPLASMFSEMLKSLGNLKKLKMYDLKLHGRLKFIPNLPESMEELLLSCEMIDDDGRTKDAEDVSMDLSKLRNLRKLTLIGYRLRGKESVSGIAQMEKLTDVKLDCCKIYRSFTREFTQLTNLTKLSIRKSGINDEILTQIVTNNPGLEMLDISEAVGLTDESVMLVSTLPKLEDLEMTGLSVTLNSMDAMPSLKSLTCDKCRHLTNESVAKLIRGAPNLELLDVTGSSVTFYLLNLANAAVGTRENNVYLRIWTSSKYKLRANTKLSPLLDLVYSKDAHYVERDYDRCDSPDKDFDDPNDDYNDEDDGGDSESD